MNPVHADQKHGAMAVEEVDSCYHAPANQVGDGRPAGHNTMHRGKDRWWLCSDNRTVIRNLI